MSFSHHIQIVNGIIVYVLEKHMPCFVNIIRKMELPQILSPSASHCTKCFCNFIRILSLQILLNCEIGIANRNITFLHTVANKKSNFYMQRDRGSVFSRQKNSRGNILSFPKYEAEGKSVCFLYDIFYDSRQKLRGAGAAFCQEL